LESGEELTEKRRKGEGRKGEKEHGLSGFLPPVSGLQKILNLEF